MLLPEETPEEETLEKTFEEECEELKSRRIKAEQFDVSVFAGLPLELKSKIMDDTDFEPPLPPSHSIDFIVRRSTQEAFWGLQKIFPPNYKKYWDVEAFYEQINNIDIARETEKQNLYDNIIEDSHPEKTGKKLFHCCRNKLDKAALNAILIGVKSADKEEREKTERHVDELYEAELAETERAIDAKYAKLLADVQVVKDFIMKMDFYSIFDFDNTGGNKSGKCNPPCGVNDCNCRASSIYENISDYGRVLYKYIFGDPKDMYSVCYTGRVFGKTIKSDLFFMEDDKKYVPWDREIIDYEIQNGRILMLFYPHDDSRLFYLELYDEETLFSIAHVYNGNRFGSFKWKSIALYNDSAVLVPCPPTVWDFDNYMTVEILKITDENCDSGVKKRIKNTPPLFIKHFDFLDAKLHETRLIFLSPGKTLIRIWDIESRTHINSFDYDCIDSRLNFDSFKFLPDLSCFIITSFSSNKIFICSLTEEGVINTIVTSEKIEKIETIETIDTIETIETIDTIDKIKKFETVKTVETVETVEKTVEKVGSSGFVGYFSGGLIVFDDNLGEKKIIRFGEKCSINGPLKHLFRINDSFFVLTDEHTMCIVDISTGEVLCNDYCRCGFFKKMASNPKNGTLYDINSVNNFCRSPGTENNFCNCESCQKVSFKLNYRQTKSRFFKSMKFIYKREQQNNTSRFFNCQNV